MQGRVPILPATGSRKIKHPEQSEGRSFVRTQDTQFCTTCGGQNWQVPLDPFGNRRDR